MSRFNIRASLHPTVVAVCVACAGSAFSAEKAAPAAEKHAESPVGEISLAQVVALALEWNPELAVFSWDIRAAEARQIQARLRPNPELSLEIEDIRLGNAPGVRTNERTIGWSSNGLTSQVQRAKESRAGSGLSESQITLSLSQLIELGGKRAKRIHLAALDRNVSTWDYEVVRAEVLKNVSQAFASVLAAQERVALDDELVTLAEQVANTIAARVSAGRVSPLEETRARTALETARVQANASKRTLAAARSALAALWGDKEARFDRVVGEFEVVQPFPPLDKLQGLIEKSPDLSRWMAEIEKRQAAIAVEKSRAVPDVTVSAGFRTQGYPDSSVRGYSYGSDGVSAFKGANDSDRNWDNRLVIGASIPLPLFNRNKGSVLEAKHLAAKAEAERHNSDVQAHAGLSRAYEELSTAYDTLLSLKDKILPAATQTFEQVNEAYRQGKLGYLDVLDAQRTLFQARQQYLDALAAYHQSVAEIERITGMPLINNEIAKSPKQEEK